MSDAPELDPRLKLVNLRDVEPLAHAYELEPGKAYIVVIDDDSLNGEWIRHLHHHLRAMGVNCVVVTSEAQITIFGMDTPNGAAVATTPPDALPMPPSPPARESETTRSK